MLYKGYRFEITYDGETTYINLRGEAYTPHQCIWFNNDLQFADVQPYLDELIKRLESYSGQYTNQEIELPF